MDYGGARGKHLKASTIGEHLKTNTSASNNKCVGFTPLISIVNSVNGNGSRPDGETNLKGNGHGSAKNSDSSDTASSSSSTSSSDNFFQVNPKILPKFRVQNNIPKPNGSTKPLYKIEKLDVSSDALYRLEESINGSPESTSQFSDITYESLVPPHMSPTQSPVIQVMERPGDFDPNRIPSSIFSRPSTPTEWSVASNDSLFSIHIGNNSFSRDHHASRIGADLYKSGELPKSGELIRSGELCPSGEPFKSGELCQSGEPYNSWELFHSGELYRSRELYQSREHVKADDLKRSGQRQSISFSQTSSQTRKEVDPNKNLDMAKTIGEDVNSGETGRTIDEPIYDVPKALISNQVDTDTGECRDSFSTNHHPDKTETSVQSFPLPIKKKSSCPMCHCPDCSQALCCCKWPSCSCKCSSCSCKWIKWPNCSFKCPIWTGCFRNFFSFWKLCCCKRPSCHCKCPNLSSCCCCNCTSCWPSCCTKCPSWPSCKCQCSSCAWACCYCWNREPKRSCCQSSNYILTDGGTTASKKVCPEHQHTIPPTTTKASSKRHCTCFSCSSSCSCCSCSFCC